MDIALFGTTFLDIKGFSFNAYDPVGRNVGSVKFVHGGVGRNVAENLGVLGCSVIFGSTIDDNAMGREIVARLAANRIDTSYIKRAPSEGMGMFMAMLDPAGELVGSISRMPDLRLFEAMIDERGEEMIGKASHVALEIDLNAAIAKKIVNFAKALGKPVYGIPGNLEVVRAHKSLLADMACFICNDVEAVKLFDADVDQYDAAQMKAELVRFMEKFSMRSMVVTLGERGAIYCCKGMREAVHQAVVPVKMVDSTGAGDAFFSGVITGLVRGDALGDAVRFGARVAAFTIQSEESTCIGFTE